MSPPAAAETDALLDRMRYQADPLADSVVSGILGSWNDLANASGIENAPSVNATQWRQLAVVSRLFGEWQDNRSLIDWKADGRNIEPRVAALLATYVQAAQGLPAWADHAKIERAEALFMEHGVLSCTLLFSACLPECYVIPDLASVLHVTGQLEAHTEYRIRATAAMILPVMMQGGLTAPDGGGIAKILKARLIHATIRNLILRGSPEEAVLALGNQQNVRGAGVVAPLASMRDSSNMYEALFAHGWKLGEDGLPCNQEEQAYTLLTFGYVFLRSLRRLGLGLERADEEAYLHAWNVVGYILGIRCELLTDTMERAAELFAAFQARGRSRQVNPDSRPGLAQALMQTMEHVMPARVLKPIPVLMTHYLCGRATAHDLGLTQRVTWWSYLLFVICMSVARGVDHLFRLVLPRYSFVRLIAHLLGYQFITKILMDPIQPLKLPQHLLDQAHTMMKGWFKKPKAAS